jgi:3,4-dihydroxy 2-butanone 4-phosphate synthase / GTP cyclohydrolase II
MSGAVLLEARSRVTLRHGDFELQVYRSEHEPTVEHVALVSGNPSGDDVLVRVHSECLTGDAFGSQHCDCGEQLDQSLEMIGWEGRGAVVYLRQEGRGIGLGAKIRAYALQAQGLDTFEANRALGLPEDARKYEAAQAILSKLGVRNVRLLSNNPEKAEALRRLGVDILWRVPMAVTVTAHNARYLDTKRARGQLVERRLRERYEESGAFSFSPSSAPLCPPPSAPRDHSAPQRPARAGKCTTRSA